MKTATTFILCGFDAVIAVFILAPLILVGVVISELLKLKKNES